MKKFLLFTILIALGFAGGTIMPRVWAHSTTTAASTEKGCNCGCGQAGNQLAAGPSGSELMLIAGLVEAISKDSDGSLSKDELLALFNKIQKEYPLTPAPVAVTGTSASMPVNNGSQAASTYYDFISRVFRNSYTDQTTSQNKQIQQAAENKSANITPAAATSAELVKIESKKQTAEVKQQRMKNNNGLGNGSEPGDGSSADIKGVDPSNPANGHVKPAAKTVKGNSNEQTIKRNVQSHPVPGNSKSKKEKEKNNNGLGNGSEPADHTSTDVKGVDPSNPGKGSSHNKAGKK